MPKSYTLDPVHSHTGIDVDAYDGVSNHGYDNIQEKHFKKNGGDHLGTTDEDQKTSEKKDLNSDKKLANKQSLGVQFQISQVSQASISKMNFDPLKRTGRPFGSLLNDMKFRYPLYWTDIKDAFNLQCLATLFFLYFAILAPAITFGGILSDKTDRWLGATEMLLGTSIMGVMFALVGGQPLLIIAGTGKALVFEDSLYQVCKTTGLDFLSFRFWISIWVAVVTVIVVASEATFLVRYFTRFTKDVFALLISLIFIIEAFVKVKTQFDLHPLYQDYDSAVVTDASLLDNTTMPMTTMISENITTMTDIISNKTFGNEQAQVLNNTSKLLNQPNTALLSFILTFGTFIIAYFLRMFKNSLFLGRSARRLLGDFGVPIAIAIMVGVDILIKDTYTEKLDVPDGVVPTDASKRGWIINPMGQGKPLPTWAIFAAIVPGLLFFILIFMEVLITSMIINRKERNLQKGPGYNIDLLFIGLCTIISGVCGFPFISAAIIRSVSQTQALEVYKKGPDGKQHLVSVKEQRLTGLLSHILLGVSTLLGPVLRQIPLSVLVGVFLYMGVCALNGIQMFIRLGLVFKPSKHHPDEGYAKNVGMWKMHLYTFIQLICLGALWAVKSTIAALSFPFVLIIIAVMRLHVLKYIFTDQELYELDNDGQEPPPQDLPEFDARRRRSSRYEDVYERSQMPP